MAIGQANFYNNGIYDGIAGVGVDWPSENHYWVLLTSSYVFSVLHDTLSDVSLHECNDPDYAPLDVSGDSVVNAGQYTYLNCNDVNFGDPVTITAKWLILVKGTVAGKSGLDKLICAWDLNTASGGSSLASKAGSYIIDVPVTGFARVYDPSGIWYNEGISPGVFDNWTGLSKYAVLLGSGYTPSITHDTLSDISAHECTDPDYVAKDVTTLSVTRSGRVVKFDLADLTWGSDVSITARYIAIIAGAVVSRDPSDVLLLRFDLGAKTSVAGEFSVAFSASGVSTLDQV